MRRGNVGARIPSRSNAYAHGWMKTDDFMIVSCNILLFRVMNQKDSLKVYPPPNRSIKSPIISECGIHYECKVVYKAKVIPSGLPQEIVRDSYPSGNYHTLYFGEILSTHADGDIKEQLPI